jgi:integrase
MSATYQRRGKRSWLITVHWEGQRERRTIHGTEQDARDLVKFIHKQELAGVNVVETVRTARAAVAPSQAWPRLRDDVPTFIEYQVSVGEWTGETPISYRRALNAHVFDFKLSGGRVLGDVPVDQVTPAMLGEALDAIRRARKSLALQERIRSPLRAYYRHLIKRQGFTARNPTEDLSDYMVRELSKRARQRASYPFFEQPEGPVLFRACEAHFPRWLPFLAVSTLAGLRWGESAALQWGDIDITEREIRVQRALCDETREVKAVKDKEDRWVPLSPQLGRWLEAHRANMTLEAGVKGWGPEQRQWVFLRENGELPRYPSFLQHFWQKLLKGSGLRYRKFHSTRHTFITWAAEGCEALGIVPAPILAVRDWAGHSSVQETERYFHRVNRRAHARHVDGLDRYVQGDGARSEP